MPLEVIEIDTVLPDREEKKRLAAFSIRKSPWLRFFLSLDNGACREIVVPERVGRLLIKDVLSLPLPEEDAFDAIHELEYRVCFLLSSPTCFLEGTMHQVSSIAS